MTVGVHDHRACSLGEGPLWHPSREQLFWFDINNKKLLTKTAQGHSEWQFDDYVSAAGWVDDNTLLIASEAALWRFNLDTGKRQLVVHLEEDQPITRSNDGRADPWGGFWIGTMGKDLEPNAGAIYRYYQGELRKLYDNITVSNAICFSPDKHTAYFTDTPTHRIMQVELDPVDGWPTNEPQLFADLSKEGLRPDGAVVDVEGCLWNAQYGAGRVARYSAQGEFLNAYEIPASQTTCPAFGGPELTTLYVTSAAQNLDASTDGQTFKLAVVAMGQREYRVIL